MLDGVWCVVCVYVTHQMHFVPICIWTQPNAYGDSPKPKCIWRPHRRTQMHTELTMRAQMHLVSLNTQNTNPNAFGGAKYPNESPNAFGDENFQIPNAFPNLYLVSTSSYSSSYSFHSSSTVVSSYLVRKGQSCRNFHT